MRTTIDAAGRVVIPKELRDEAGLTAGTVLTVRVVDGVVEIAPATRPVRMVWKDGFLVAERTEPGPAVGQEEVDRTIARIRGRSIPPASGARKRSRKKS